MYVANYKLCIVSVSNHLFYRKIIERISHSAIQTLALLLNPFWRIEYIYVSGIIYISFTAINLSVRSSITGGGASHPHIGKMVLSIHHVDPIGSIRSIKCELFLRIKLRGIAVVSFLYCLSQNDIYPQTF